MSDEVRVIRCWGYNRYGQIGDNTTETREDPTLVSGDFGDWETFDVGSTHGLGIRSDGSLWKWGQNWGRISYDKYTPPAEEPSYSSPVLVPTPYTDWTKVSSHYTHNMALRENGTLWTWGYNTYGQFGNNSSGDYAISPIQIPGFFTDASAGGFHSIGVLDSGNLMVMGRNNRGQLGDGTTASKSSPVSVVGGFTDWAKVAGGSYHSIGLRDNGSLWAWGRNYDGQLGDLTTESRSSPVSVISGHLGWSKVSSFSRSSMALRDDGTIWTWGNNYNGQLGDSTTYSRSSPVMVSGIQLEWIDCSIGELHSLGVTPDNRLYQWGNHFGAVTLEDPTLRGAVPFTNASLEPAQLVEDSLTLWYLCEAGGALSCGKSNIIQDFFPLVMDCDNATIEEIPHGDNLDLYGCSIVNVIRINGFDIFLSSDKNLKKDIRPIENAIDLVKKLQGVSFQWEIDSKDSIGLIAQDVERVIPEVVQTFSFDKKSISYGNLIALLIEAFKDQQRKIKALKSHLKERGSTDA